MMQAFLRKMMIGTVRQVVRFPLRRFEEGLRSPGASQMRVLEEIIPWLARTQYGRAHGLQSSDRLSAFQKKLPIVTYETLSNWIERERKGETGTLAAEPVLFYERTSGTSGPSKWIPYTASLKSAFNGLFTIWTADLLYRGPLLMSGRTFISISPKLGESSGAETDLDYLSDLWRLALTPFLVLPSELSKINDPEAFRHLLALYLLAEDPEIISIWNPSFLSVLLDYIEDNRDGILQDWRSGAKTVEGYRFRWSRPSADREALLQAPTLAWPRLLPSLRLLSCWSSGQAALGADRLRALFPDVFLQGKGLLATETPVTVPLIPANGAVPLVTDVFFEFEDAVGKIHLLKELEIGEVYHLIVTPRGGFARYKIGDDVRVTHRYLGTPCLEFLGRESGTSDLVGEKLHELFVDEVLNNLGLNGRARTLVPVLVDRGSAYYALAIEGSYAPEQARLLDQALQTARRYREARVLGQLAAPQIIPLSRLERFLQEEGSRRGIRWGDLKPTALYPKAVPETALKEFARA